MHIPSHTLDLFDSTGAAVGTLHLSPSERDPAKGDCIFDVALGEPPQSERSEVRWIAKRNYRRSGEHRFKLAPDGGLTVRSGDFELVLVLDEEDEGVLHSRPDQPRITAVWSADPD